MLNYIKYKLFEKRILREIEQSPAANLMYTIGATQRVFEDVIEKHAFDQPIDTIQARDLAKHVADHYGKTDIQTLAMMYTTFLWSYAFNCGKTLKVAQEQDVYRHDRVQFGLERFNVVEKRGHLFLAPLSKADYDEYHKKYERPVFAQSGTYSKYISKSLFLVGILGAAVVGWTVTDTLLEKSSDLSGQPTGALAEPINNDQLLRPAEYKIEAYQFGGHGIRNSQVEAYLTTEQGYLKPVEEYATVSFNNGGYYMYIGCMDGYEVTKCEGGIDSFITDTDLCGINFADVPKTRAEVLCSRQ